MPKGTVRETDAQTISSILRSEFQHFEADSTYPPKLPSASCQSIGIDNRQRCEYDLAQLRRLLSVDTSTNNTPLVQVVGDSRTPFDEDKIPGALSVLSSYAVGCMIEYGFTASKHDANWLVAEYRASHPETVLIANIVQESIEVLGNGCDGCMDVSRYLLLFDRLSPTRYGDDIWLTDGIMFKENGDKMICFEGGPQALYQCSTTLLKGIQVVAVTGLRSERFSAAHLLCEFKAGGLKRAEENLAKYELTSKQSSVARWCLPVLDQSALDIASLVISVQVK